MSVNEVIKTARTITTILVKQPENREVIERTFFLTERYKAIEPLFRLSEIETE